MPVTLALVEPIYIRADSQKELLNVVPICIKFNRHSSSSKPSTHCFSSSPSVSEGLRKNGE